MQHQSPYPNEHNNINQLRIMLPATLHAARRVILSVGSGDGSQQVSFLKSGHTNIVTTFYEEEEQVIEKYPQSARKNIDELKKGGTVVLFGVDATKLHDHPQIGKGTSKKFDLIVFTFPHTGIPNRKPESISSNKLLIRNFLDSAQHVLTTKGEICITLKTGQPYDKWAFPELGEAKQIALMQTGKYPFFDHSFPGYVHRSTLGVKRGVPKVRSGNAISYTFGKLEYSQGGCSSHSSREEITSTIESSPGQRTLTLLLCPITDDEDVADQVKFILSSSFSPIRHKSQSMKIKETVASSDDPSKAKSLTHQKQKGVTVLDIRREIPEAIRPDTRQLNRVLYGLEKRGYIRKNPPPSSNIRKKKRRKMSMKPRWFILDSPTEKEK